MKIQRALESVLLPLALAVFCVSAGTLSFAQTAVSEITGVVTDPTGLPLSAVSVTLTEAHTGFTTPLKTNDDGTYYSRLLPGTYSLKAEASGFKMFLASGLELSTGQVLRYDFKLDIGEIRETIQVVARSVEIQKDSGEVSSILGNEIIQGLPSMTRKTFELLNVAPTVSFANGLFGRGFSLSAYQPFMSIGGNPGWRHNIWIMDGTNNSLGRVTGDGGTLPNTNPPPESIYEMRVLTNNYSAEFGQGIGGVVVLTTNSGTNALKGQLYYYGQNDAFEARNYFSTKNSPNHYHNFGGAVGGPIIKGKTFFFANVEWELWKQFNPAIVTVPTLLQRQGDFSQTFDTNGNLIPIYDPATTHTDASGNVVRDPFPGNIIPANRIDPVALAVLKLYPVPNLTGTITGGNNFVGTATSNDLTRRYQFYRIDHQLNENNKLYFRFTDEYTTPNTQGPFQNTEARNYDPQRALYWVADQSAAFAWSRIINPTTFSDFRITWANFGFNFKALGDIPQVWNQNTAAQLGLKNLGPETFPAFSFSEGAGLTAAAGFGYYPIGGTPFNQQQYKSPTQIPWTFQETLNLVRGTHNIRVGAMWQHSQAISNARPAVSGKFSFDSNGTANPLDPATGNPIASMLVGWVSSGQVSDQASIDRRNWSVAGFIQDDWHANRSLTLNLGLRYEYDHPPVDAAEGYNLFDAKQINPACNCPGVIVFSRDIFALDGRHVGWYNDQKSGVMPRFGFAWSPFSRQDLVVRGGFGLFLPGQNYGDSFWGGPQAGSDIVNATYTADAQGLTTPFLLQNALPSPPAAPFNSSYGAVPIGQSPDYSPVINAQNRSKAYYEQFNFGIQKQFGGLLAEVGYLGNLGRNLPGSVNINQVPPSLMGPGNAQLSRPFPQFGSITEHGIGWARSNYNAGFVQLRRAFVGGLSFTASYTYARELTNIYLAGVGTPYRSVDALTCSSQDCTVHVNGSYGAGTFDIPQRFVWSSEYELPFGPHKRWLATGALGNIVGGWRVGSMFEARSGNSLSFSPSTNTCNCFTGGTQGVIASGKPKVNSSGFAPKSDDWFDTSVFSLAAPFTFGSAYPGLVRGPGFWNFDSSISKRVNIGERYALDIRGDFFDIFNHPNWGNPNTRVGSPQFGSITSTVTPGGQRIVQLGAKLSF
jgi:Carboxypeptidase regulatory-like domain